MKVCVFDTETTGLYNFQLDHDDPRQPQIVELGWLIGDDETGDIVASATHLVKLLPGVVMKPEVAAVHGLTEEVLAKDGRDLKDVLALFRKAVRTPGVKCLVAHNLAFDRKVIEANCARARVPQDILAEKEHFCTMLRAKEQLGLEARPKLADAYKAATGEDAPAGHRALIDVGMAWAVYLALKKRREAPRAEPSVEGDAPAEPAAT